MKNWLKQGVARDEGDLLEIINAAIGRFLELRVELPPFQIISHIAESALKVADEQLQDDLGQSLGNNQQATLDELLQKDSGRTPLDYFKEDVAAPSPKQILFNLERLEKIETYLSRASLLRNLSRRKIEHFASIGVRYHASELRQLKAKRRAIILLCFLYIRRSQLLDAVAELFIRIWENTCATAKSFANAYREARIAVQEEREKVLENLLEFICRCKTDHGLIKRIRTYRTPEDYRTLLTQVWESLSWNECFHAKIKDHYTSLRRFLPQWYETISLEAMTSEGSLLDGIEYLNNNAVSEDTDLPPAGVATEFLSSEWKRRAIVQHAWSDRITRVFKAPYELGIVDATARSLKDGTIAIGNACRYAPMTTHLVAKQAFLENYDRYCSKLGLPANATDYCHPLKANLSESLSQFDQNYKKLQHQFRINRGGKLGYSRPPNTKPSRRITKLAEKIHAYVPPVTIMDILLDCHHLTGFLDFFRPVAGRRQNMREAERIVGLLAALYAYGCNSGPTQAAQALGLRKQTVLYMRRHYMGTRQLTDAVAVLVDFYMSTSLARLLGDPGIFMTDAMRFPTFEDSLTARHHFRYKGTRSILLYQHVTSSCICFFTKAILCNIYEAVHMLDGILKQRSGFDPVINICDSAGKSDFIFGLAHLLNISIWPRISGRQNLKLWKAAEHDAYHHITPAISGSIQWHIIERYWEDIIWVLASIIEGTANPSLIAERFTSQPHHPVTLAIAELGKAVRSGYLLDYGMDMYLRSIVIRYTSRRETWNRFGRDIFDFGGRVKEKSPEGQEEIFWFLTVVQNAIVLWNALALEHAIKEARSDGVHIADEDLKHILPTMLEHINFVGHFNVDLKRRPRFKLAS